MPCILVSAPGEPPTEVVSCNPLWPLKQKGSSLGAYQEAQGPHPEPAEDSGSLESPGAGDAVTRRVWPSAAHTPAPLSLCHLIPIQSSACVTIHASTSRGPL